MDGSDDAAAYFSAYDRARRWAAVNRSVVAHRIQSAIGTEGDLVCDTLHNGLERTPEGWLHRKGAADADRGVLVIAGSRGAHSFLVRPVAADPRSLRSIAHSAGRKWKRGEMRLRLADRFSPEAPGRTDCGNRVICADKELLYKEAPQAYKDIRAVIRDLKAMGLVSVIASFLQVITYKSGGRQRPPTRKERTPPN
jgi:release factor H-coupled RctB family protein